MKKNYYAVKKGMTPGIYETWDDCKAQTEGFPGAIYKGFATLEEAEAYMGDEEVEDAGDEVTVSEGEAIAYVDGSFDEVSGNYGAGIVILLPKEEVRISHMYNNPDMAEMRNVAGEIMASVEAMRYAASNGIKRIKIYHDYQGISSWCNGEWKTEKEGTKLYKQFYEKISEKLDVEFVKVKGHSNNKLNDLADYLAKEALGLN